MFPVILELVMRESLVCFSHLMGVFALFNGGTAVGKGTVDNATSFVKAIEDFESHFDLIYGQYVVDAKSLLGVMTMDIRNKVDLRIMERENEMPTIMKAISPYIAA